RRQRPTGRGASGARTRTRLTPGHTNGTTHRDHRHLVRRRTRRQSALPPRTYANRWRTSMFVTRHQYHATWLFLAFSLNACSDDTTDTPNAPDAAVSTSRDVSADVTTDTSYDSTSERSNGTTASDGAESSANSGSTSSSTESRAPDAGVTSDATFPTTDVSDAATE